MFSLTPLFSLWVGPNASDFLFVKDTLIYADMIGAILRYVRRAEGWRRDTFLLLPPGIRHLCRCGKEMYVAHFYTVHTYVGDSIVGKVRFPFVISGIACKGDTLLLYDFHTLYAWIKGSAPTILYHTEDDLKYVFLRGDTLLLLQRNYLLTLSPEPETVVVFEDLADIRYAHPLGNAYLLVIGSGDVVAYLPKSGGRHKSKNYLIMNGVRRVRVKGDTVAALVEDSVKVFILRSKRKGGKWIR